MDEEEVNQTNSFNQGHFFSNELKEMGYKFVGEDFQIAKKCTIIFLGD